MLLLAVVYEVSFSCRTLIKANLIVFTVIFILSIGSSCVLID